MTNTKQPTQLDIFREMNARQGLDADKLKDLYRLKRGAAGEKMVLDYLDEFGQENWQIRTNLWLYEYGLFEIDLLLLTQTEVYIFEIKNYNGNFKYVDSQCYFSDDVISQNPISQTQRAKVNLQNILNAGGMRVDVKGVLLFTGKHSDIDIQDSVNGIDILTINQFRKLIYSISADEKRNLNNGASVLYRQKILRIIDSAERKSPYQAQPLSALEQTNLRRGIKCAQCASFNLNTTRSYIICNCGVHEPREMAIVRTICEYGIINFDKDLVASEVFYFFGGDVSQSTVERYLKHYFIKIEHKSRLIYMNPSTRFEQIINQFTFSKKRYLVF